MKGFAESVLAGMCIAIGITAFLLCGFGHCVANMFCISMARMWSGRAVVFSFCQHAGKRCGRAARSGCKRISNISVRVEHGASSADGWEVATGRKRSAAVPCSRPLPLKEKLLLWRLSRKEYFTLKTTKQMAANAMLAAMCAVLGAISIDMGNIKITFESIPILLGALLFGPADGAAVGFVGTFVYQVLRYGFSVTTLLWMLPYVLCGLIVGQYARLRAFHLTKTQTILIVVMAELIVTTLNTGVMYIDSKLYGYYSAVYIFGMLLVRYAVCVGKAVAIGAIIPSLLALLRTRVFSEVRQK